MENLDKEIYLELDIEENSKLSNDVLAEKLINNHKKLIEERLRLIECSNKIIEEYQEKINMYKFEMSNSEEKLKQYINVLIPADVMESTKTQYTYKLPSAKIIRKKSESVIKQMDKDKLFEYLKLNNKAYIKSKVVEEVDWKEYKKKLIIQGNNVIDVLTGEIVDSCKVEIKPEVIEFKLD